MMWPLREIFSGDTETGENDGSEPDSVHVPVAENTHTALSSSPSDLAGAPLLVKTSKPISQSDGYSVFFLWMSIITTALSGKADVCQAHTLMHLGRSYGSTPLQIWRPAMQEVTPHHHHHRQGKLKWRWNVGLLVDTYGKCLFAAAWPHGDESVSTAMRLSQRVAKQL